jgi:dynein heavy chain, axonemal
MFCSFQNFLDRLKNFDKDNVSDKVLKKIGVYTQDRELDPEKVGTVSTAAKSLMLWVQAVEKYGKIYKLPTKKLLCFQIA